MDNTIKVYVSDSCPYCVMLKRYLDDAGIDYEERNVSREATYLQELMALGAQGVPTTVVNDDAVVIGYQPDEILKAAGIQQQAG